MTTHHLGLDLGGTNIKVAMLVQDAGQWDVTDTRSIATGAPAGPDAVAANLIAAAREMIELQDVATVGLGVPGHFDRETGKVILFPNLAGDWEGFPLRHRVEDAIEKQVWMINDARAFTLSEGLIGAGRGCHTVACITLGTGVGGGVMIDGKLHRGAYGVAGELGHQTVEPDGPLCGCGNRGCVEALTKAEVLASAGGKPTAGDVFEAARRGDRRAIDAVAEVARYLGIGLANVVAILGPDRIVVGGGIAEAGDLVMGPIVDAVRSRVTLVPTDRIAIVPARFGRFSGAVGAALAGALRQ